ncbi:hypothetical protein MTR_7g019240 [Medicago truncatula]|uniref:Uncharacterized protein n=1 Tax=Medicago truncatula TaxID=3880 RepID=A0A072U7Q4_MEDTR|nr:hypothetical protein MTR_7g019240 [Medicago truncatula]
MAFFYSIIISSSNMYKVVGSAWTLQNGRTKYPQFLKLKTLQFADTVSFVDSEITSQIMPKYLELAEHSK